MTTLHVLIGTMVAASSGGIVGGGILMATAPAGWGPTITAVTALIIALSTLLGVIVSLVKVFENRQATRAQAHSLTNLAAAATNHEARIDRLTATQAKLEALTGVPLGTSPADKQIG